jgi:hypothetical protein
MFSDTSTEERGFSSSALLISSVLLGLYSFGFSPVFAVA